MRVSKQTPGFIALLGLLTILLAGCSSPGQQAQVTLYPTWVRTLKPTRTPDLSRTPTPFRTATLTPTITVTRTLVVNLPTPRTEIQPHNPLHFVQASGRYQLVEILDPWCEFCLEMAPLVHQLESEWAGKIDFIYIDWEDPNSADIKGSLDFQTPPEFFLIGPDGTVLDIWNHLVTREQFEASFREALNLPVD